jgi:protoporphyrinogen/coproporphyrinogen III oxidase
LRFAKDIGIIDELILADSTLPRFVFWEGELYPLPSKLTDPVLNFNLMTWPGKIRAGLGAIGLIAARPKDEESVKQFVTRHLGLFILATLSSPFITPHTHASSNFLLTTLQITHFLHFITRC